MREARCIGASDDRADHTIAAAKRRQRLKIDLFYELPVVPGSGRDEARTYAEALDEIELADRLGFHGVWLTEHHLMPGYSHSSKPELVLAALARRTSRLRLGLGVIPLPYHHPVHVAERIATLDLLCSGRLEVGIGRGFSPQEFATFGADMAESRALVEESLAVIRAAGAGAAIPPTARRGAFPDGAHIVPQPRQRPHPPLWAAAVSPESYAWAAHEGLGVLAGPFKPWFMIASDVARYRHAWRDPQTMRIGMTVGMLCLDDGARARRLAGPAFRWFYGELLKVVAPVLERLVPGYEGMREIGRYRRLARFGAHPRLLDLAGLTVVGTPAECLAKIARYREAGVTHLMCAVGAGVLPTDVVKESLACIADRLIPALAST